MHNEFMRELLKSNKKNAGFTLIELMIAFSLMIALVLGISQAMIHISRSTQQSQAKLSAQMLRMNHFNMASAEASWRNTLMATENSVLACLRDATDCTSVAALPQNLRRIYFKDVVNNWLQPLSPTSGYTADGFACSSYPSIACCFRYEYEWKPQCTAGVPCVNPISEIQARFVYNTGTPTSAVRPLVIDAQRYSFQLILSVPVPLPSVVPSPSSSP